MAHLFDPDSPLMELLSRVFDGILLSVTALVCALPVVTAGPSAVALYAVLAEENRGGSVGVGDFFRQLRRCWKPAAVDGLVFWAVGYLLFFDVQIVGAMASGVRVMLWAGLFFLALCLLLAGISLVPLTAADPTAAFFPRWRRALLVGIARLPRTLAMLAAAAAPLAVLAWSPKWFLGLGFLWIFFWPAFTLRLWVRLNQSL